MDKLLKYPKLLRHQNTALLIIDIQDRIYQVVRKHKLLIDNVSKLIEGSNILEIPIFYTEQYPKGLGSTVDQLKKLLNGTAIQKLTFSCFGAGNLFEQLKDRNIEQVIVTGMESHVCVLQTVLDLLSNNFQVNLVVDAISSRKKIDYLTAVKRMENEGAILTTVEAVLFELLQICGNSTFKAISKLVK